LIFTLFGEYILPRGGSAWTASLLALLRVLGVSERAARSTLSRMSQKSWLASKRVGRYSRYALTRRGKRIVREGEVRIFEPRQTEWDGQWHMLVYSIPENKRALRSKLRTRLGWLGFGHLAPGTWISPIDRQEEVGDLLDDLNAQRYAVYFAGMQLHFATQEEVVRNCWNLPELNRSYATFLKRHEPVFKALREARANGEPNPPAECFRQRFWLTFEFSQFPRRDPNLPAALLPADWLGARASELFTGFHQLLRNPSERFVDKLLESDPSLVNRLEVQQG
jgi:phenylacetic acid degradation operon negative regulatory protein